MKGQHVRVEMWKDSGNPILLRQREFLGGSVSARFKDHLHRSPANEIVLSEKYTMYGCGPPEQDDRVDGDPHSASPGRWARRPGQGRPVTLSEINNIAAIAEIAYKDGSLIPDLPSGPLRTRMDIFTAIYPKGECFLQSPG